MVREDSVKLGHLVKFRLSGRSTDSGYWHYWHWKNWGIWSGQLLP